MRILCMGDTHIPERAKELPDWVVEKIQEVDPSRILFTGDVTEQAILLFLEELAPVYAVRGNMDHLDLPNYLSLEFDGLKVMLMHGHQFGRGNYKALTEHARGHDFLVCGHTHVCKTFKEGGVVVVNPGSATGAWGGSSSGGEPSMAVIDTRKGGEQRRTVESVEILRGETNGNQN